MVATVGPYRGRHRAARAAHHVQGRTKGGKVLSASATRTRAVVQTNAQAEQDLWTRLLAHLRGAQPDICRQWFEEIEPLGVAGGILRLRAHSPVHRDYLQRQCIGPFNDAARAVSGRLVTVRFLGPEDDAEAEPARRSRTTRSAPQAPATAPVNGKSHAAPPAAEPEPAALAAEEMPAPGTLVRAPQEPLELLYDDGLVLNPDYAFEHFVVGPGNRLAHAAAMAVSATPGRAYNPYFVHGDVGLGKTHLLQAICLRIRQVNPKAVIYYTSCEGFMTQFIEAVQAGQMTRFRYKFRHVDVLVIDDIHFLAKRDRTQEEFFHTFNALYQSHKQIVLSSDAAPDEIPALEQRLVSRFKWGLVTSLAPPCFETRVAILKNKAKLRGFELGDDVANYVAGKIDTNIRELEGAVVKIQMISTVEKKPPSVEMARGALGDEQARSEPRVQIQTIINIVTDFYNVKMTDLQSKRRQRSIALPRQVCMYIARRNTRYSLEEIGGYFGGRDHTTVMHAVRTVEDRRSIDTEFDTLIRSLEDRLRAPGAE